MLDTGHAKIFVENGASVVDSSDDVRGDCAGGGAGTSV